ncbi:hypothetical protein FA15DRAFT_667179 [Coprinopsis marcescibilis]|uniref:F-box domain-containing protein n=1 Tax=Coprinopsis marcescibilis TaxID=230819 RepID=A0A5C3L1U6_COPMA|nr:hypothetical protein FA15DRAFT_667179 [Coprinopsis marcescibilis]
MATDIFLQARPLSRTPAQLLLLPLLPVPLPLRDIPTEIWNEILGHSLLQGQLKWGLSLLLVCKEFKDLVLPLIYANVHLTQSSSLQRFCDTIHAADRMWDSIRRIPYSTPGRWVQCLDLSDMAFRSESQALQLDSMLANLFPLVPFLSSFYINPSFILSRRALFSLSERDGAANLRMIGGLTYLVSPSPTPQDDTFVRFMRCCPNLEEVEVIGLGLEPIDHDLALFPVELPPMDDFQPLHLPKLRNLSLMSMHSSPLMLALLYSPLPMIQKLTLTPYDDLPFPNTLVSALLATHGQFLRSLLLFTPKSWPTRLRPSPNNLLTLAPNLRHLSLENPLPSLLFPDTHGLQIISIPRPSSAAWHILEPALHRLPQLAVIRARDVRWLRKGISSVALDTGVQGQMREWKRRLARKRIRLLDSDWNEDSLA